MEGRVEVYHEGEWGRVCRHGGHYRLNHYVADMFCKSGGYENGEKIDNAYSMDSLDSVAKVWLDSLDCGPGVNDIAGCRRSTWGKPRHGSCVDHSSDAVIRCEGELRSPELNHI